MSPGTTRSDVSVRCYSTSPQSPIPQQQRTIYLFGESESLSGTSVPRSRLGNLGRWGISSPLITSSMFCPSPVTSHLVSTLTGELRATLSATARVNIEQPHIIDLHLLHPRWASKSIPFPELNIKLPQGAAEFRQLGSGRKV